MSGLFLERLFLPASPEPMSDDHLRRGSPVRIVISLGAIAIDVFIYLVLRGSPAIRQPALRAFALINISLLLFNAVASWVTQQRLSRPWRPANDLFASLECLAIVVWVQVTGSVSSYFIVAGPLMITLYRGYWGHRTSLIALATLIVAHATAFVLESVGVLQAGALFASPPGGLYSLPEFRLVAICSIGSLYVSCFVGANLFVSRLRVQGRELEEAQRDLARAAEGARHGRLTGTTLGSYALGELLGRGGMGEVYAGRTPDGAEVAVKVMHPHLVDDATVFERFRREAEAGARVPGGYCPLLHEIARAADVPYIVMELLHGEDLGAYLRRRGPLPIGEVVALTRAIAEGVDALHGAGVIHRDLKPANLFLEANTAGGVVRVRILDLGVCKLNRAGATLTKGAEVFGTPSFMAPEQARGRIDEIGPQTDVFALGAIVYRALTGKLAFPAGDLFAAIDQVCNTHPPTPSSEVKGLSGDVDDVVALALAKRSSDRYPTATAFARDLALAAAGALDDKTRARAARLNPNVGEAPTLADTANTGRRL